MSAKSPEDWQQRDEARESWWFTGDRPDPAERMLLLEITTRIVFPTVLVFSVYLLLTGHYRPGGGFSGGLVAGLAFVLHYISGGQRTVGAVARVRPPVLVALGLSVAVLTGLAPLLAGAPVLSSTVLAADLPVLGHVKVVTSLFLDLGVYLLIVGVVLDLLRTLGAGIERDARAAGERS